MTAAARRRGFTLLEVMVALAILALSLTTVFDVVGNALRAHERARDLETATLLARAKLAEVEAKYQQDGFKDFDETGEGRFEEEGHPDFRWALSTLKPQVELGADGVLKALTGVDGGLDGLLGALEGGKPGAGGQASGPTTSLASSPFAAAAKGLIQQRLTALGEELKKGVRQVRLTVSWPEGKRTESFTVVTHLVILQAGAAGTVAPVPGLGTPGGLPPGIGQPGILPGIIQQKVRNPGGG